MDQRGQVCAELDPAVLPQVRGQPGASRPVRPGLQPGKLPAEAVLTPSRERLVVAKPPGQANQGRGEASSSRATAGIPACRGGCASRGVPASAGAYRSPPSSTRVASIPGVIGGDEGNQGGGACLEELEGTANVVKATSAAHRTPVHYADRWFCELDGMVDGVRE